MTSRTPEERRAALQTAQLMLLFTPELCEAGDPRARLAELLPLVDIVQLRIKPRATRAAKPGTSGPPAGARETYDWARVAIELCAQLDQPPLLLVDDRVDVLLCLRGDGLDGVHLGQGDLPVETARELLGADPLIGLSTHDVRQVVMAQTSTADYIGFGPIFPTATKGYERAIGPEAAWVASVGSSLPLFPIGGIDTLNANTLKEVGRVALSTALLNASDPRGTARALRQALEGRTAL